MHNDSADTGVSLLRMRSHGGKSFVSQGAFLPQMMYVTGVFSHLKSMKALLVDNHFCPSMTAGAICVIFPCLCPVKNYTMQH